MIVESLTSLGVEDAFIRKDGFRSAAFNGVIDADGNFKLGVADMEVLEDIEIAHIQNYNIQNSHILVLDGNLNPECMKRIFSLLA